MNNIIMKKKKQLQLKKKRTRVVYIFFFRHFELKHFNYYFNLLECYNNNDCANRREKEKLAKRLKDFN